MPKKGFVPNKKRINRESASLPKGARDRRNWTHFSEGPESSAPEADGRRFASDKLRMAREYQPGTSFQVAREGGVDEYGVNLLYPSAQRQRNALKWNEVIPKLQGTNVYATLSEQDIDEFVVQENAVELEKLYKYVLSLVDPRVPGHLDWLRDKFPSVYNGIMENRKRRQALQNKRENLDMFGIQNEGDAMFALQDKSGYFEEQSPMAGYVPGFLAPRNVYVEDVPATRNHAGANWHNWRTDQRSGTPFDWGAGSLADVQWHNQANANLRAGPRPNATRRLPTISAV